VGGASWVCFGWVVCSSLPPTAPTALELKPRGHSLSLYCNPRSPAGITNKQIGSTTCPYLVAGYYWDPSAGVAVACAANSYQPSSDMRTGDYYVPKKCMAW